MIHLYTFQVWFYRTQITVAVNITAHLAKFHHRLMHACLLASLNYDWIVKVEVGSNWSSMWCEELIVGT